MCISCIQGVCHDNKCLLCSEEFEKLSMLHILLLILLDCAFTEYSGVLMPLLSGVPLSKYAIQMLYLCICRVCI